MITQSVNAEKIKNFPKSVRKYKNAINVYEFCDKKSTLILNSGSYVVFDMGAESVGGYPTFEVKSHQGKPKLLISYSDRFLPYEKEETMAKGDFTRGSCTYLGVELPVMPANPYRFEEYTISRNGRYVYPLIQGQQRFIMLSLQGANGSVEISDFAIIDDSQPAETEGLFESDNRILDGIWQASARTLRLATVKNNQWDVVCEKLLVRKLTKAENGAISKFKFKDKVEIKVAFELSLNPEYETGTGILFFAKTEKDGYLLKIMQSGSIVLGELKDGNFHALCDAKISEIVDNVVNNLVVLADKESIKITLNGENVLEYRNFIDAEGAFGFWSDAEWRSIIDDFEIVSKDFNYKWKKQLDDFKIVKSGYFISDGAKRDRLPWTGDLDWAFDSGWYSHGEKMQAINTLKILAKHQNPQGFIFGTCYPENEKAPEDNEYGDYQSDMFAAWFIISAFTYYRLSGDCRIKEVYPNIKRCLDYLWKYVDKSDGLFDQRYETSKGLWDHVLGDTGKNTYTNLIILQSFIDTSKYAKEQGELDFARLCEDRANVLKKGIFTYLYDYSLGGFIKRKDWRELCEMSNPFAMAKALVTQEQADQIASHVEKVTRAYGKVAILMMNGLYHYGYPELAEKLLLGKLPYITDDGFFYSNVDWASIVDNPDYPETVYECMHNPPFNFGDNLNWGDLSHPDSGVCGIISSRIAGILPIDKAFSKILIKPHPCNCKNIHCIVPTIYGKIEIWIKDDVNGSNVKVLLPQQISYESDFSLLSQPVKSEISHIKN